MAMRDKRDKEGAFDTLVRHLDRAYGELWYEYAGEQARSLIDAIGEADWIRLGQSWQGRKTVWQVQLADALFASRQPGEFDLLTEMLHSQEVVVALAAAATLLAEAEDQRWRPGVSLLPVLERLRAHGEDLIIIEGLIQRVGKDPHTNKPGGQEQG